jgi:flagellar biosynthesis protein FliR
MILSRALLSHGALILVFARILGLCWTAPVLAVPGLDVRIRIVLAAVLGAVLAPVVGPGMTAPAELAALGQAIVFEVLVGGALGWSAALIVAGARQAGELVGAQAGLSAAALFDPEVDEGLTPLGHLYGLIALAVFLALDGPLVLIRALVESYRVLPAGGMELSRAWATEAFGRVQSALELALCAAAPAAVALAGAGLALGLLGRAVPSFPQGMLSLPVRSALGVVIVWLGLVSLVATLAIAWKGWPGGW